jgi:hypothetical protein
LNNFTNTNQNGNSFSLKIWARNTVDKIHEKTEAKKSYATILVKEHDEKASMARDLLKDLIRGEETEWTR